MLNEKKNIEKLSKFFVKIHDNIIENSVDKHDFKGIRDEAGLYYISYKILNEIIKKSDPIIIASYCYQLFAVRHLFHEGNKRTAHVIAQMFLVSDNLEFDIDYEKAKDFIIKIARKEKGFNEIKVWLKQHTSHRKR